MKIYLIKPLAKGLKKRYNMCSILKGTLE